MNANIFPKIAFECIWRLKNLMDYSWMIKCKDHIFKKKILKPRSFIQNIFNGSSWKKTFQESAFKFILRSLFSHLNIHVHFIDFYAYFSYSNGRENKREIFQYVEMKNWKHSFL
jgi:hypothetical protein